MVQSPLDYFLWGYVKSMAYANKAELRTNIEREIAAVSADLQVYSNSLKTHAEIVY